MSQCGVLTTSGIFAILFSTEHMFRTFTRLTEEPSWPHNGGPNRAWPPRGPGWGSCMSNIRSLLAADDVLYLPGAWDGFSARLIEQAGFSGIFTGGMAIAASLGLPDAGLYSMSENLDAVRRIAAATDLPLFSDIDNGYGNAANTRRTVRMFEQAGASAFFIEDQQSPKRCPASVDAPVAVDPIDVCLGRLRAAVDGRRNESTVIVARIDAWGDEARRRAEIFATAGVDMLKFSSRSFTSSEDWRAVHETTGLPLLASLTPDTWVEREFSRETMVEIGVQVALLPLSALYSACTAIQKTLAGLRSGLSGAVTGRDDIAHEEFSELFGFSEALELERKYIPA